MKYYGYFTKKAAQAIKGDRIMCRTYDDGKQIYITNGYIMFVCTPYDYEAIFRAALGRDPGDWSLTKGASGPCDADLRDMLDKAARTAEHKLERVPLEFTVNAKQAAAAIAEDRTFTAIYNPLFLNAVTGCDLYAAGKASAAVYAREGQPVALIMPVRINEAQDRTIRAYVDAPALDDRPAAELEAEIEAERGRAAALEAELAKVRTELEKALTEKTAAQEKAEDLTPAQQAVARVEALGLTATIKGAQTAAPVVWINGGEDRAEDLKKAGAVWSGKKNAFYIRVA